MLAAHAEMIDSNTNMLRLFPTLATPSGMLATCGRNPPLTPPRGCVGSMNGGGAPPQLPKLMENGHEKGPTTHELLCMLKLAHIAAMQRKTERNLGHFVAHLRRMYMSAWLSMNNKTDSFLNKTANLVKKPRAPKISAYCMSPL